MVNRAFILIHASEPPNVDSGLAHIGNYSGGGNRYPRADNLLRSPDPSFLSDRELGMILALGFIGLLAAILIVLICMEDWSE